MVGPGMSAVSQETDPGLGLDVRQIVIVGQSLGKGGLGSPALTPSVSSLFASKEVGPYGVLSRATAHDDAQRPALTMLDSLQSADPDSVWVESTHSAADTAYVAIKKGTTQFATAMARVQFGADAASRMGLHHEVVSVHFIHGEKDHFVGTTRAQYAADLAEWIGDYRTDVYAITGQVPVGVVCQTSSWDKYVAFPETTLAALDVHRDVADMYCVGPKYHLPYVADGIHLTAAGYFLLGEYHARVVEQVVLDAGEWEPVAPSSITRVGTSVVVQFTVPTGPLVVDTSTLDAVPNHGFSWHDDTGSTEVESVEVTGSDEVTVALASVPTGANPRLGYGVTNRGGNLRDSAAETSVLDGRNLWNWCCHFFDPVPFP